MKLGQNMFTLLSPLLDDMKVTIPDGYRVYTEVNYINCTWLILFYCESHKVQFEIPQSYSQFVHNPPEDLLNFLDPWRQYNKED